MDKFFLILSYTYTTKLKTKAFIITTIIMIACVTLMGNMSRIMDMFKGNDVKKIAIIDQSHILFQVYALQLKKINKDIEPVQVNSSEKQLQKDVFKGKYDGYLVLSLNEGLPSAIYKAPTLTDTDFSNYLEQALQIVKGGVAAAKLNLSPQQLSLLSDPVSFKQMTLGKNGKTSAQLAEARGLVYVLLFAIYFAVLSYANMVGTEIAKEKATRVMEILISSAAPVQQMFAKIAGIALLGLTQMAVLLGIGYLVLKQNMNTMQGSFFSVFGFGNTSPATILYAIIFFLLGYLLYATLAAFLGSLVSRIEDVQQVMLPMTFLVMIGFFIAMSGLGNPEAGFVTVTSYIPFFTPMIMFMRMGMLDLPIWQGLIGILILVVSILIFALIGAKIYRGGVLMYGKNTYLKNIKKALQLSKSK
ncbi:ABC transporter permease [Heyndrickxia acidicola]|uniref:ABC transporter permease n=1 Tax=Heyndrickxia acidicola TaxID=209389 RepID=A0ABU6MFF7_9BACI|nr:ABC transporter permease [Heyndrickxia acidicola]MED1202423.1 ABC transporter permease [Heyndrickxia acidicola]